MEQIWRQWEYTRGREERVLEEAQQETGFPFCAQSPRVGLYRRSVDNLT